MRKFFTAAGGILFSAALLLFFYLYNNSIHAKRENNYQKEQESSEFNSNRIVFSFPKSTLILEGQLKEKVFPYIENPKVTIVVKKLTKAKIELNRKSYIKVENLTTQKVRNICSFIEKVKNSYATITESKLPED